MRQAPLTVYLGHVCQHDTGAALQPHDFPDRLQCYSCTTSLTACKGHSDIPSTTGSTAYTVSVMVFTILYIKGTDESRTTHFVVSEA